MANIRKNWRSLFAAPLVLLLAAAPAPASAQTTADQVKDKESLRAFVLDAKRYIESITDYNELMGIRATLQEKRKWVSGETYLMLAQANGSVPFHAGDRSAESKNILAMRDDRGVEVVRKMIDVADNGGGFVDYVDGELKTSYAVKLLTGVGNITFYLIGGYSQDLSSAPPATVDLPKPAVTAAEVVDKETLVAFVEAAAAAYRRAYESKAQGDVMAVRNAFREEGGHWRAGSVYLWIVGSAGITILHATEQSGKASRPTWSGWTRTAFPFPNCLSAAPCGRVASFCTTTTTTRKSKVTRILAPPSSDMPLVSTHRTLTRSSSSARAFTLRLPSRGDWAQSATGASDRAAHSAPRDPHDSVWRATLHAAIARLTVTTGDDSAER